MNTFTKIGVLIVILSVIVPGVIALLNFFNYNFNDYGIYMLWFISIIIFFIILNKDKIDVYSNKIISQ
jgi:hypothetical protein